MKPLVLTLAAALLPGVAPLDSAAAGRLLPEDYANLLRIDLRAAKARVVTEALELTPDELERFWPVYREYDKELSKLNAERINLLREFASNFAGIDDRKAGELTARNFELAKRRLSLLERQADRIAHATSPLVAARFVQIEEQLLMLIDVQLASDFPLIPRQVISQAGAE